MASLILTSSPTVCRGQIMAREHRSAAEMLAHYAAVDTRIRTATVRPKNAAPEITCGSNHAPASAPDPFAASRDLILDVLDPEMLDRQPKRIIAGIAAEHGLSVADLVGPRRTRPIVRARFAAVAAVWDVHRYSPARIGTYFGGRDQTTIRYALQVMGRMPAGAMLRRRAGR